MSARGGPAEPRRSSLAFDRAGGRRLLAVAAAGLVPWTAVLGADLTLVFSFGLVNADPWFLVTVLDYLRFTPGGRTAYIDAWLLGAALYGVALGLAVLGTVDLEDPRLTGGLLVCAAVSQFPLVVGFSRRLGYVALPLGSLLLLAVAWWCYWPVVRARAGRTVGE